MLHEFLKPGPWFRVKKYGYGAGLPINCQGWAFLGALVSVLAGIGLLAEVRSGWAQAIATAAFVLTTTYAIMIANRRTDGEWQWRWGDDDPPPPRPRSRRRQR